MHHTSPLWLGIVTDILPARQMADDFGLQIIQEPIQEQYALWLKITAEGLELYYRNPDIELRYNPLFTEAAISYRRRHTSIHQEPLARAVGLKNGTLLHIVDATAGWGRDSFILASLGAQVTLVEQSPILAFILNYNINNLIQHIDLKHIKSRMDVINADSYDWLRTVSPIDVIYLDPMFPEKSKTALAKKEMQILQALVGVGFEEDSAKLFDIALKRATKRVVVKRPIHAPFLGELKPSFSQEGKSARFDVYMI